MMVITWITMKGITKHTLHTNQPKRYKHKIKSKYLHIHLLVHFVLLLFITKFNTQYIVALIFIVSSHFAIDCAKLYFKKKKTAKIRFFHRPANAPGSYCYCPYEETNYDSNSEILFRLRLYNEYTHVLWYLRYKMLNHRYYYRFSCTYRSYL